MTEQWRELKVTITEMRDNDGTGTQQEVCKFLANLMETLEKQMQEPCEDCIRRSDVVQWLERCTDDSIEYAIDSNLEFIPSVTPSNADTREAYIKGYDYGVKDWFKDKTQPYEDCISRQAVIDYAKDTCVDLDKYEDTEIFCDEIKALPPVTPQRTKGKWIKVDPLGMGDEAYMCSECRTGDWSVTIGEYKFCPYCGAEMSGGGEDGDSD